MRAVQINCFGGPEVLEVVELPDPEVPQGMELLEISAAGVNYADTHQTEDSYLARQSLPLIPGSEVVGRTSDGRRRVALVGQGGYAERVAIHPTATFDVPDQVSDEAALALVLQGATAWHLLQTSARLSAGESVVIHAAAGGVGTLAVQLAKAWGAGRVIAVASTDDKRRLAMDLGADTAISGEAEGLKARILEANDGKPVDIVLEMAGGQVFDESLSALAPFGRLVTFGMASRVAPSPITSAALMATSRAVVGFWLVHCMARPPMMRQAMTDLFARAASGDLRTVIAGRYPLGEVRRAHEDLLARRTVGKLVLDPTSPVLGA